MLLLVATLAEAGRFNGGLRNGGLLSSDEGMTCSEGSSILEGGTKSGSDEASLPLLLDPPFFFRWKSEENIWAKAQRPVYRCKTEYATQYRKKMRCLSGLYYTGIAYTIR